jgi:peptidoglycan/LPS O-acetylase OafA/YrhL
MLSEQDKTGRLSLKNFYVRRAFRIFPPYYTYLAVVLIAGAVHLYPVHWESLLGAATYTLNYFPKTQETWLVAHCWSLCIEEQFYLLWPTCLAFLPRHICLRLAAVIVVLSPLVRIATYYADPDRLGDLYVMSYTHADALMVGSFIALALSLKQFGRTLHFFKLPSVAVVAAGILILLSPYYSNRFRLSAGLTLDGICAGALLLYSISHAESIVGRVLNQRFVKHIGIISYSLYLWQQMFTGPDTRLPPWNLLAAVACAEASFWCIEKPSFILRDRFFRQKPRVTPSDDRRVVIEIDAV